MEGRAPERVQTGVESSPRDDHIGDDHREASTKNSLLTDAGIRVSNSTCRSALSPGEPTGFIRPGRMLVRRASASVWSSPPS